MSVLNATFRLFVNFPLMPYLCILKKEYNRDQLNQMHFENQSTYRLQIFVYSDMYIYYLSTLIIKVEIFS